MNIKLFIVINHKKPTYKEFSPCWPLKIFNYFYSEIKHKCMSIFLDISYISKNKSMKTIEDIKDN